MVSCHGASGSCAEEWRRTCSVLRRFFSATSLLRERLRFLSGELPCVPALRIRPFDGTGGEFPGEGSRGSGPHRIPPYGCCRLAKGCWTDHLKPLKPHHGVLRNGRIQVNKWSLIVRLHHRVERIDFREKSFHRMQKLLQKRSFVRKR